MVGGSRRTGRTVHPEMQWANIAGADLCETSPDPQVWERAPRVGYLPPSSAHRLTELCESHTSTPDRVWFAVWNGWGGLGGGPEPAAGSWMRTQNAGSGIAAPTFHLPERDYYLLSGQLDAISSAFDVAPSWIPASLWWPKDRAWCVATEIDLAWTYLCGTKDCVETIVADSGIEALPAEIGHRFTHDSDHINTTPGSTG